MEKVKYKPLHERLQADDSAMKSTKQKHEDTADLFRMVFETDNGQLLLEVLVNKYIGRVPSATATPNEIMFLHGQSYVIHEILNHMRKEK